MNIHKGALGYGGITMGETELENDNAIEVDNIEGYESISLSNFSIVTCLICATKLRKKC